MAKEIFKHSNLHIYGLILLAISLPFSLFLMSVSIIFLFLNWVFSKDLKNKIQLLFKRKSLLFIVSIYMIHLLGTIYSHDYNYTLHDLRIKLPLLLLPIIIGTSTPIKLHHLKIILLLFISSVIIATFISGSIWIKIINYKIQDTRDISIFISHIRFALLINMAIYALAYFIFTNHFTTSPKIKLTYTCFMIWLITFLFVLQSFTGIIVFICTAYIITLINIKKIRHLILRLFVIALYLTSVLLITSFITRSIGRFYYVEPIDKNSIERFTSQGNLYFHDFNNKQIENNQYIWLYVCEKELRNEWNKVSNYLYDGKDKRGQEIKHTLIRYLTSKGYRKDADGIKLLTKEDIKFIEGGNANFIYNKPYNFKSKIYQKIWEIDVYLKGGNPSGNSITQRFVYFKTALQIIKNNYWIGVGTGDVKVAYKKQYEKNKSILNKRWQLRAHNQFLTFLLTFGIFGFLWILFALVFPIFYEKKQKNYFTITFIIIAFLSMLNEDTLETHAGISFFSFFYSLFLFGLNNKMAVWKKNNKSL